MASIAIVSDIDDRSLDDLANRLAIDLALFEQRGCLSIQTIYTDGSNPDVAEALPTALERAAERWPTHMGSPLLAAIQQFRAER